MKFTIITTTLKLPISTSKPLLLGEIGECPRELNIDERKLSAYIKQSYLKLE